MKLYLHELFNKKKNIQVNKTLNQPVFALFDVKILVYTAFKVM